MLLNNIIDTAGILFKNNVVCMFIYNIIRTPLFMNQQSKFIYADYS